MIHPSTEPALEHRDRGLKRSLDHGGEMQVPDGPKPNYAVYTYDPNLCDIYLSQLDDEFASPQEYKYLDFF